MSFTIGMDVNSFMVDAIQATGQFEIDISAEDKARLNVNAAHRLVATVVKNANWCVLKDDMAGLREMSDGELKKPCPETGKTALTTAVDHGKLHFVTYLVEDRKMPLTGRAKNGQTLGYYAAGNEEVARFLKSKGMQFMSTSTKDGSTTAHIAASKDHLELLVWIAEEDSRNLLQPMEGGYTPLHIAAEVNRLQALKFILSIPGVNIDRRARDGTTSLIRAVNQNCKDTTKALIDAGANLEITDNLGRTAAYCSVEKSAMDCLQLLADAGACFTGAGKMAPLRGAVESNNIPVIKLLVSRFGTECLVEVKPYAKGAALSYLDSVLSPKKTKESSAECANCTLKDKLSDCSRCKLVKYCGKACQVQHWKAAGGHKKFCVPVDQRKPDAQGAQAAAEVECLICLTALSLKEPQVLLCNHVFHKECIAQNKLHSRLCPLCRENASE